MSRTHAGRDANRTLRVAAVLAALGLGWLVISQTYGAYLALNDPKAGLSIGLDNTFRRAERAVRDFDDAFPPPSRSNDDGAEKPAASASVQSQVREALLSALRASPLDPRLLRRLAQMEEAAGEPGRSEALMRLAVGQSRHETMAVIWLLQAAFDKGDYAAVAGYADILLRTRRSSFPFAYAVLGRLTDAAASRRLVADLLASKPPWRSEFFNVIFKNVADQRSVRSLAVLLNESRAPATETELIPYLTHLVRQGNFQSAYYYWLEMLPEDRLAIVGKLNNGSFELPTSRSPFDWVIADSKGAIVEFTEHPLAIGRHVLSVTFNFGRVEFGGVSQLTVLGAGKYRLVGRYRGELKGRRGFEWQVSCAGAGGKQLAQSPMFTGVARDWTEFEAAFDVPQTDCDAQIVRLTLAARSASEQLVTGEVLYDDLRIEVVP